MKSLGLGRAKAILLTALLLLPMGDAALGVTSGDLGSDTFSDVAPGHWADEAIGWAFENGITAGVSEDLFDPDGILNKAQIFTLLHRAVNVLHTGTASGSTAEGTIAFTSNRDGDPEVYLMNGDGTNLRQLTKNTHSDTSPSWSPDGKHIAFQSDRDGDSEIFTMNADGTNVRQLTKNTHSDTSPSWSPDGKHIAFQSDRDGDSEIFTMNAEGTNQTLLTNNGNMDSMPSWSPDGSQITFQSDRDGDSEIFTMNADGTNVRQLTKNTRTDTSPSWSPDGKHIAFSSGARERFAILVMDADGSDLERLTTGGDFRDAWPNWSPDSASILFTRSGHLFQVKTDGTDLRQVTPSDGFYGITTSSWSSQGILRGSDLFVDLPVGHWADVATGWAVSNGIAQLAGSSTMEPDGLVTRAQMVIYLRRALAILPNSPVREPGYDGVIVFTSHRDGWNQVEAVDADGANHRLITYTASNDRSPSWSPDGSQIAFESDRDGDFEIYAVGVDGTRLRQITNNEVDDWSPVWSPDGSKIAYMSRRRGTDGIWYRQVMVMNADGTGQRQLTTINRSSQSPSWSPDANKVAFALSRRVSPGAQGIYYQLMTVAVDGTNLRSVTSQDYSAFSPSWSPDGAQIAFTGRPRDGGYYQIFVVNPDGTGQRQLTDTDRDNFSSTWSPDSTHIAFASERDGNPEIYIMKADGSEPRRLTNSTRSIPSDQAWWSGTIDAGSEVFTDVPTGHPADQAIGWALSSGVTSGVGEDLFDPEGTVTRAQMVTFLHRAAMLVED